MPAAADDRYLRYVIARLAAYRNVWWSLANEYDFLLNTKPMGQWPLHLRQCVQRVIITEWESDGNIKRKIDVEFTDRQHALFLLGKHLKLYEKSSRQMAPFTLVLNTQAPEGEGTMKKVGDVIEGIGLHINIPETS